MSDEHPRVVVAGGGPAAIEALLALREHLGDGVSLELVSPEQELVIRAYEVVAPFRRGVEQRYPLGPIAEDLDVEFTRGALAGVLPAQHSIVLRSGHQRAYDALVVAVGAHQVPAVPGAMVFRGARDAARVRSLLLDARAGITHALAFVLPGGNGWPLPLYELALQSAAWLEQHGSSRTTLTLVSPEREPLEMFGPEPASGVATLLEEAHINFVSGFPVRHFGHVLRLAGGGAVPSDVAIALHRMTGPRVPGLPCDEDGYLLVDRLGRVTGVDDVWAAGDAISFPIKQGGLATQQAAVAAASIAAAFGAGVEAQEFRPVLRAVLLGAEQPWFVYAEMRGDQPVDSHFSQRPLWPEPGKLVGRGLAPYLAGSVGSVETTEPVT